MALACLTIGGMAAAVGWARANGWYFDFSCCHQPQLSNSSSGSRRDSSASSALSAVPTLGGGSTSRGPRAEAEAEAEAEVEAEPEAEAEPAPEGAAA